MDQSVTIPLVVAAILAIASLAVAGFALVRLNRIQNRLVLLSGGRNESDFVEAVAFQVETTQNLGQIVAALDTRVGQLRNAIAGAVQRVGVVRYDAFADMGGHLSFSAAFLDENGTGLVLTCINGRTDSRIYAKGVKTGRGEDGPLSEEENAAIALAMDPEHVHHEMV
ncbi:MAG: DUF4446 family protein [Actinobacteria bacterium ATB1]|nr:DUF4446 family protein [Actinobacteria bacterium ATB1]